MVSTEWIAWEMNNYSSPLFVLHQELQCEYQLPAQVALGTLKGCLIDIKLIWFVIVPQASSRSTSCGWQKPHLCWPISCFHVCRQWWIMLAYVPIDLRWWKCRADSAGFLAVPRATRLQALSLSFTTRTLFHIGIYCVFMQSPTNRLYQLYGPV